MSTFQSIKHPQVPLFWIAMLRIMLGVMFLTTWLSNLSKGFYTPEGLQFFFSEVFPQSQNSLTWEIAGVDRLSLSLRGIFAPFQLVAEFLLGLFLLVGFLTPFTSVAAAFFITNTFLATFGHDWPWSYVMILGILGGLFFTKAGRSLGIDTRLAKNRSKPPNLFHRYITRSWKYPLGQWFCSKLYIA